MLPKKSSENVVRSTILIYNTGLDLIIYVLRKEVEEKKNVRYDDGENP